MIQMCVGEKYRVEYEIGRRRRSVQRLGFLSALKLTAINQDPRLPCLDDVTGPGYFAASSANQGDFHCDDELVILGKLKASPLVGPSSYKLLSAVDVFSPSRRINSIR